MTGGIRTNTFGVGGRGGVTASRRACKRIVMSISGAGRPLGSEVCSNRVLMSQVIWSRPCRLEFHERHRQDGTNQGEAKHDIDKMPARPLALRHVAAHWTVCFVEQEEPPD